MSDSNEPLNVLETLYVNHRITVYQQGSSIRIKLLDGSSEGNFIDEKGAIQESANVGVYYIPFIDGTVTVGTGAEVAAIVKRLPMTVERYDHKRSYGKVVKHYEVTPDLFPEDEAALADMLNAGPVDYNLRVQPWFPLLERAMAQAVERDLFA